MDSQARSLGRAPNLKAIGLWAGLLVDFNVPMLEQACTV
jgi:hypothetical protein